MKLKYIYLMLLPAILLAACSKKVDVNAPTLNITLDNSHLVQDTFVYKLGDTVKFAISGYAGNLAVYTGDAGHNYDFRNRTNANGTGVPQISFTSTEQYGTQTNTLKVLATNALAVLDSAHIVNANWTDITSRTNLSTGSASNTGTVSLADLIKTPNDSLVIAFEYNGITGSTQRTWTITNFVVNTVLPDQTQAISSLTTDAAYWTKFKIGSSTASWAPTTTQLQVVGGAATAPNNTSWIVSKPLYVNRVAPDLSVGLKNIGTASLTSYNYKYAAAGSYTATFVIFNNSVDEQKTVVKQFKIKITN